MTKFLIPMLVVLLANSVSFGQYIQPQHRVPNSHHGCCGPATLKTVAQYHGHKMQGYMENLQAKPFGSPVNYGDGCPATKPHACHSWPSSLQRTATSYGIPTTYRQGYDTSLFRRGVPVIISYNPERKCQPGHIVAYVGGDQVYDPNHPGVYQSVKWHLWRGDSLILK